MQVCIDDVSDRLDARLQQKIEIKEGKSMRKPKLELK